MAKRRQRRPRSDKFRDLDVAAFPTFVFAPAGDLPALLAAQHSLAMEHPPFTILQRNGGYPTVSDASLQPLQEYETHLAEEWQEFLAEDERARLERIRKRKRRRKPQGRLNRARSYVMGQTVRVLDPAFEGLTAEIVERKKNGELVLIVNGVWEIKVDSCDIEPVHVASAQHEQVRAA